MTEKTFPGNQIPTRVLLPMAPPGALETIPPLPPSLDQPFVDGRMEGPSGRIPRVSSNLKARDHLGAIKARFGVGRMHYTVDPGLYALGQPHENSPVLVSANYKMSFDSLRGALPGRDAWILVLDTKGINVWCAAGKGTFGTGELLRRIETSGLKGIVRHRDLIVPQLGAPGVAAHLIRQHSGFKVHYGPVSAADLPSYLDAGMKATPAMRTKTFTISERVVLIPIELMAALKTSLLVIPVMFLISGIGGRDGFMVNLLSDGVFSVMAVFGAIIAGAILNPILLPYLPGRAFSIKGFTMGSFTAFVLLYLGGYSPQHLRDMLWAVAWLLMVSAVSAYLAMNFTGASTYTSLSGVKKEMRWALPLEMTAGLTGFAIFIISRFIP